MTLVIGGARRDVYRAVMPVRDEIQHLAAALERPRGRYRSALERTRTQVSARSVEAARQLDVFAGRIADLTIDELGELHEETFRRGSGRGAGGVVQRLARRHCDTRGAREALDVLAPVLVRLDADRNPFAYVVRALCCVLLSRVGPSRYRSTED